MKDITIFLTGSGDRGGQHAGQVPRWVAGKPLDVAGDNVVGAVCKRFLHGDERVHEKTWKAACRQAGAQLRLVNNGESQRLAAGRGNKGSALQSRSSIGWATNGR